MVFTSWFFGPAVIERVVIASGGECILHVPAGEQISLPIEMCYTKAPVSHLSHPHLFSESLVQPPTYWQGAVPRLKKGHDISGHIFLLTMSTLFLADQLRASLRVRSWSQAHTLAVAANVALIAIWLFATYTTSVYFHSPLEKATGYGGSFFPKPGFPPDRMFFVFSSGIGNLRADTNCSLIPVIDNEHGSSIMFPGLVVI
jgi:hypothetical protein